MVNGRLWQRYRMVPPLYQFNLFGIHISQKFFQWIFALHVCTALLSLVSSFNLSLSLCCPYLLPQFSSPCVVFYQAISIARTSCSLFPHFRRVAADSSSASLLRRIASRYPSTISLVASLVHSLVSQHRLGGQIGCFLVR